MQRNIRFRRAARAVDAMRRAKELKLAHCDECALGFQRAWRSREARRRLATMVRRRYLSARLLRRKAWRRWAEVAHVLGKVAFVSAAIMRRVVAMRRTLIDLLPRRVGSGLAARLVRAMTEADPAQVAPAGAANPGGSPASWPSASERRADG